MKTVIIAFLFCAAAQAATKLEIPLEGHYFVNHRKVEINVAKLNRELSKSGLDGLPEIVVVGENPRPYYNVLKKRIEAANAALRREMHFNLYDDRYLFRMTICYRGEITDVPKLVEMMNGNFLRWEQGILAIGAGKSSVIYDDAFRSEARLKERFGDDYENLKVNINKWLKYNSNSKVALIMSDYGSQGDGTELEATSVPPCK